MDFRVLTYQQACALQQFALPSVWTMPDREGFWYLTASEKERGFLGMLVIRPLLEAAQIVSIGVVPTAEGQGVASGLLQYGISLLEQAGIDFLTLRYAKAGADWGRLDALLERNGFFQDAPPRYGYKLKIGQFADSPLIQKAMGREYKAVRKLSTLEGPVLRAFRAGMEQEEIVDSSVLNECDPELSYVWMGKNGVQACMLNERMDSGLYNTWMHLAPASEDPRALLQLFVRVTEDMLQLYAPDSTIFFSCQNEESDRLLHHLIPDAQSVMEERSYVRALGETADEDAVSEETLQQEPAVEQEEGVQDMREPREPVDMGNRAERWADMQLTPVTNDEMQCKNCKYQIEDAVLRCQKYARKPGGVMYGQSCSQFEPQ